MIGKNLSMHIAAGVAALVVCIANPATAQVTFDWATVGNPGNAADPLNEGDIPGIGSVPNDYRIAKREVTNDQYVEFLNAVAATDTNSFYTTAMGANLIGGIARSGVSGSFTYSAKTNMGNKPVNYVSFFDCMRLVNWLHNGQPTGAQDAGTTEEGVYTISNGVSETRAGDARFFIPTENEWYKAAYHDPGTEAEDGPPGDDNYWRYPMASDGVPTVATANANGDINNPGADIANYNFGAIWNGLNGNVTTVGSAGALSESFYGTSDQGGNTFEWTQTVLSGSFLAVRGGSWSLNHNIMASTFQGFSDPTSESTTSGFRVASPVSQAEVPTVSEWGLAAMALLILTAGTIVNSKRVPRPA